MTDTTIPAPVRALLAMVLDALDLPHPATVGGSEAHDRLLATRVVHARIALRAALDDTGAGRASLAWTTDYLRERLTEHPVAGYVTSEQAHAALAEGKTWTEAVTLPGGEDQ